MLLYYKSKTFYKIDNRDNDRSHKPVQQRRILLIITGSFYRSGGNIFKKIW